MDRVLRILPAAALIAMTLFGAAGSAAAAPATCATNPTPGSTISGAFTVNSGQNCVLAHVTVMGPVTVNGGGSLTLLTASLLRGLTSNSGSGSIVIVNSTVTGNTGLIGGGGGLLICGSQLNGAVSVGDFGASSWIGDPGEAVSVGDVAVSNCTGNQITGSLTLALTNANLEVEGNLITGKNALTMVDFEGEFAGNSVTGAATCSALFLRAIDTDHATPNSYTGTNNGCPVTQ